MDVYVVVIQCPNTGKATRTGHEIEDMDQFKYVGLLPETTACVHCNETHTWTSKDAWIERHNASRVHVPPAWSPKTKP
jgi:hypothetical protein